MTSCLRLLSLRQGSRTGRFGLRAFGSAIAERKISNSVHAAGPLGTDIRDGHALAFIGRGNRPETYPLLDYGTGRAEQNGSGYGLKLTCRLYNLWV